MEDLPPTVRSFLERLELLRDYAKRNLQAARQRQKDLADKKRSPHKVGEGDWVCLETRNLKLHTARGRKLLPLRVGPFKVTAAVGKVAFRLALPDTLSIHNVFHVSLLVPFRGKPPEDGKPLVPLSPFVFELTDEFLSEEILRHRECRRGTKVVKHYLVTWAGCGPEHISWQPEQ